jgi:hypothetical protein
MANIGTYCGRCCFYDNSNKTCEHGLINKFIDRGATITYTDNNDPLIDRICQYKRPENWNTDLSLKEKIDICNDEVYICGTIVIFALDKQALERTLIKLNKNPKIKNFKIIVIYSKLKHQDVFSACGNNIDTDYKIIHAIDNNGALQIYKSLSFAKNGYLFILNSDFDFDQDMIDKVDTFVNKKLYRLLHIRGTDSVHQSVSMVHLYKWLKGDLECSFKDKLLDISSKENSDPQVFTWEEVNAEYSN